MKLLQIQKSSSFGLFCSCLYKCIQTDLYGETFPRLFVLGREKGVILSLSRYSSSDRPHILEALRPLLEAPSVKKDKTTEWALKAYFKELHPRFDDQTNMIYIDAADTSDPQAQT